MKEMAEMLRKGAKMLSITCPECGAPLFQLKTGEIFCPREKREVRIIKEGEDAVRITQDASLEKTLTAKLQLVHQMLEGETDAAKIRQLTETINVILDAITRINKDRPKTK
jgi:UPF0148 protein